MTALLQVETIGLVHRIESKLRHTLSHTQFILLCGSEESYGVVGRWPPAVEVAFSSTRTVE